MQVEALLDLARRLYNRGFNVVPVDSEKRPAVKTWGADKRLAWEEIAEAIRSGRATGIAIVGGPIEGSDYYIVWLDADDPDTAAALLREVYGDNWREVLCGPTWAFCVNTGARPKGQVKCENGICHTPEGDVPADQVKRGFSIGVRVPKDCAPKQKIPGNPIEVLVNGYQVVSGLHPSGLEYTPMSPQYGEGVILSCEEWRRLLAKIQEAKGKKEEPKPVEPQPVETRGNGRPAARGWRRLTPQEIDALVNIVKPAYVRGFRNRIVLCLSGLGAKWGVHPIDIAQAIIRLHSETQDEDKLVERLSPIQYSYSKASPEKWAEVEPEFKAWLEQQGISRLYGSPKGVEEVAGSSCLREVFTEVLGEEEAQARMRALRPIFVPHKGRMEDLSALAKRKVKEKFWEKLYYAIAMELMRRHVIKTFYQKTNSGEADIGIYCYNGLTYEPCEKVLESEIERLVESYPTLRVKTTNKVVREALAKIRRLTREPLRYEPMVIAFENALFDWDAFLKGGSIKDAVREPSPDLIAFHRLPHKLRLDVDVNPSTPQEFEELAQKLCPKSLEAFKAWVGEDRLLLFEIIGYTLYPKYSLHKAVMLLGSGRNGKSTYLKVIQRILGPWNYTAKSLHELADPNRPFARADLFRKLANIGGDLPRKPLEDTGYFKQLTGEDPITADRKYKDPITFYNYAKMLFAANTLPEVNEDTEAWWRRWIIVEFPNRFPDDPTFFERTFTEEELEGIIVVALYAIREVLRRGRFSIEGTPRDFRMEWRKRTHPVSAFIEIMLEHGFDGWRLVKDPSGRVERDQLYEIYTKWAEAEEVEAVAKNRFTAEMEKLGYPHVKIHNVVHYKGLRLVRDGQPDLLGGGEPPDSGEPPSDVNPPPTEESGKAAPVEQWEEEGVKIEKFKAKDVLERI